MVAASLTTLFVPKKAAAYNQILSRSLTISSGVPGKTGVSYTFTFTPAAGSTVPIQGMKLIACTSAVDTYPGNTSNCTAPPGFSAAGAGFASATFGSKTGWQGAPDFAVDSTGAGDCAPLATHNVICANRTDGTNQTLTSRTITFNNITNPTEGITSPNGTPFYIGIYTYTDAAYTAPQQDFGATASAVVQTLTTNAAVAEVLNFCVGSTTVDNTTTSVGADCTQVSGTAVNLGTLDTSLITTSPVTTNGGDSKNAVAMVRSNAGNGVTVAYDAIQQSGTNHQGTLRLAGATCSAVGDLSGATYGASDANGNTLVDPCINAAGTAQTVFTAGTEMFGMTIAGINGGSTTSYTSCTYGDATASIGAGDFCNLKPISGYICSGASGSETYVEGTPDGVACPNGYAWDESGSAVNIASSSTSTVKQVDDEAIIMKYAATPSITTPFGPYQAQTDFIAVPVY